MLAGLLLASLIFYPVTLTGLAKLLTLSQRPEPADLILVLGGDFWGPRSLMGAELGARGLAKKVLISGPPYRYNPEGKDQPESELSIVFLVEKGYRREMFLSFPNTTKSTIDEALAVCPELNRLGAKKVLLVTSSYHSGRANLVFNLYCPDVRFRSVPAPDPQFEVNNWWKTESFRKIFFSEWQKIIGTVFWKYPQRQLQRLWDVV
jgi:uncharacterized SAM-binding protein YcdF (DUF218 family)